MKKLLIVIVLLLTAILPLSAQDFTEQDVIELVAAQPPFSYGLETVPGWTAAAYDTQNAYGIWHVQFWDSDGEDVGWANIQPDRNRLYEYEEHFDSTEAQANTADPIVREFVQTHPDIIDLLGDPTAYNDKTWIGYNGWAKAWGVWIERGDNSLYVMVQFDGLTPDSLDNPSILRIEFPRVMTYDEWQAGISSEVTALAFAQPDVAAALRGITGWQSQVEHQDDGLWRVTFMQDETEVVSAVVNRDERVIVEWSAP